VINRKQLKDVVETVFRRRSGQFCVSKSEIIRLAERFIEEANKGKTSLQDIALILNKHEKHR